MQKTAKKVCSLMLAFVLILGMLPVGVFAAESDTTQWVGTDLKLGDDLTMRFYANITSEHAADGVMTVTVDGKTQKTYAVKDMTPGEDGYVFPVDLGAPQMTAQVKLTLTSGGETVLEKTTSIRDYAVAVLEGKYTEEVKSLVKWMLNYGAAAQTYFGVNTGNMANAGYVLDSNENLPEEAPDMEVSDGIAGINFSGVSMLLKSKIALRFYFTVTDDATYTYTCNDQSCNAVAKDGMYYVEVPNINPQSMDDKVQIVATDGAGKLTVSYSPMDYITRMYRKDSSSAELKALLSYATDYFDAAEVYANGTEETLVIGDTFEAGAYGADATFAIDLSDCSSALEGYSLSGATVNGTAFTSASYADGVVSLDRATVQALEGEQTVALTFTSGSKNLNTSVKVNLYTMVIASAADLAAFPTVMAAKPAGTYVLANDIDMAGVSYSNSYIDAFTGTFDGRGYVIYNMTSKTTADDWYGGFFGKLYQGTMKNVAFVNATVKGQGSFFGFRYRAGATMENVYMSFGFDGMKTDGNWTNNTSVMFNDGESNYFHATKVILEYAEPLTDNNNCGYAFGQAFSTARFDGLYVIGADKLSGNSYTASGVTGCYDNRVSFDANVSAWDGNGFWTVVDGFPIPNRLVGVKFPVFVSSNAVGYIGQKNEGDTFVLNLSDVKDQLAGASLVDVTVDGVSFATKSYSDGVLTLDKATAGSLSGEKDIVVTFENASASINVSAKIAPATYTISTPAELANFPAIMAANLAGTYVLTNDIDMAGVSYSNDCTNAFTGIFDGCGYVVYNMATKTTNDDWDGGFFGKMFKGTLKNIAFANAIVKGQGAFLAFRNNAGTMENVYMSFAFDSLVSGKGWINDTSVLFNDGESNYLYATNVIVEYAEPLTAASAGYAFYQNLSVSKFNGLYVVGADKISVSTLPGSATAYGCYADRAAFDADVSAWDGNGFWTVVDGFPIPTRLVGTLYENGYLVVTELDMTASAYVGAQNTEETIAVDFGAQRVETAGMTLKSAEINGKAFETASYDFNTGVLTLDKASIGTLSESQNVKLTFTKDGAIYVAYAQLIPADMVFYTAAELQTFPTLMAANPAGTYALGNNIDFAGYTYENTNTNAFTGVFDGNGYCISNMATKTSATDWDGGFFGKMFKGTLKNIAFNNAIVKGEGAFLGFRNNAGTLENVYLKVSFDGLVSGKGWINDTSVLFNDGEGNYLYATNVIVEYAEPLTAASAGYAFYQNLSISKFNGLYVIGADKISVSSLPGSSTAYGCYDDRAALAGAITDFSAWYEGGFWVNDANNTPVPASVLAAARANAKKQTYVSGTIHNVSVTANTTRKLIQGGQSDYKIIVDETNTADKKAADIMIKYLARSGVTLPIVTADQYTADGKFIVINNDTLFANAGLTLSADLGSAGYTIQTVGDNVFLQSVGVEGIQYAASAFLKHTLGLEVYGTPDSISVVAGSWAWMPDFDITEQPDIETQIMGNWRDSANADVQYLMGYTRYSDYFLMSKDSDGNGIYDYGSDNHTSMDYLPKNTYYSITNGNWKWYSGESMWDSIINVPDQLCYTAHGDSAELAEMVQTAADQMMVRINAQPTVLAGQFSVSDTHTACTCSTCTASKEKYGTDAAAVIQFINLLGAEIQERLQAQADAAGTEKREFTLYLMAYHEYAIAPVTKNADGSYSPIDQTVVCGENVGVLYAPIEAMYTYDLYHDVNSDIAENMEKWASLSDHMYYWLYETGFKNYMVPYGSWFTSTENLRHSYNNNADIVMIQGQYNTPNSTGFTTLKVYLNAATGFDVNADYDALVDKFFSKYYGAAGEPMQQYYEELEAWLNDLAIYHPDVFNGFIANEGQNAAKYWPIELLLHWQELLEEAKTLAAGNTTALNHITDESMFVRYMLITAYGYTDLAADFNTDAAARDFAKLSEQDNLGAL